MKRIQIIILIGLLLLTQSIHSSVYKVSANSDEHQFDVQTDPESTKEKATITLSTNNLDSYDSIVISLPKGVTYSEELTKTLESNLDNVIYEKQSHSLKVKWKNDERSEVQFVLTDLEKSKLSFEIQAMNDGEVIVVEKHSVFLEVDDSEEKEELHGDKDDEGTENLEQPKETEQLEAEKENDIKKEEDKSQNEQLEQIHNLENVPKTASLRKNNPLDMMNSNEWSTRSEDGELVNACLREFNMTTAFEKPWDERTPIDLVLVQDASGSFRNTIGDVKQALNEVIDLLEPEDRVQVTTFQGARGTKIPAGATRNQRWGYSVQTIQSLTSDFSRAKQEILNIRADSGTPTASGLKEALESYERNSGDLTNRDTVFVLVSDGVPNARLDGYILQRTNFHNVTTPRGALSMEYNQDYPAAIAEVENEAAKIKNKGYSLISAFWEDSTVFVESGLYEDRWVGPLHPSNSNADRRIYPARPHVIAAMERFASSSNHFIRASDYDGEDIGTFTERLKEVIEQQIEEVNMSVTIEIDERYELDADSVELSPNPANISPEIEGNTIYFDLKDAPQGQYEVLYKINEKQPIYEEHTPMTGHITVNGEKTPLPTVTHGANTNEGCLPTLEKTVNGQEHYDLKNRDEQFNYYVHYDFTPYVQSWESVQLQDDIHPYLEIIDVQVYEQGGKDVSNNGQINIDHGKNRVTFNINQQSGSYAFLKDQIYTLEIETKIKDSVPLEDLKPFILGDGIPNVGELIFDDEPKRSNEVTVKPPAEGTFTGVKVDKETREPLSGATFTLNKCNDEEERCEELIGEIVTNSEGKVIFENLPLGNYELREVKAPEGYRLLKKPITFSITVDNLVKGVEVEVENSKTEWDLPKTGGIGTAIFYGLGIILMVGAGLKITRRKHGK